MGACIPASVTARHTPGGRRTWHRGAVGPLAARCHRHWPPLLLHCPGRRTLEGAPPRILAQPCPGKQQGQGVITDAPAFKRLCKSDLSCDQPVRVRRCMGSGWIGRLAPEGGKQGERMKHIAAHTPLWPRAGWQTGCRTLGEPGRPQTRPAPQTRRSVAVTTNKQAHADSANEDSGESHQGAHVGDQTLQQCT